MGICQYHLGLYIMQEPSNLGEIVVVSIGFRMVLIVTKILSPIDTQQKKPNFSW